MPNFIDEGAEAYTCELNHQLDNGASKKFTLSVMNDDIASTNLYTVAHSEYETDEVNYENLVTNTEQEIRGLLDYCDLPFDKNCLSFHKTNRVVQTASAAQVRQPMYDKSIGRWRNFETQLCSLQQMLADA